MRQLIGLPGKIAKKLNKNLTEEQKLRVYETLSKGSDPHGAFFLLVAVSTLIAAFGLVMNSTAVVIGAMLVAPLMTPILGLGLALVRGDTRLMGTAIRSEIAGVVIAILASMFLGVIVPYFDATHEMLSRTEPNLFDLLVAVFAGLAGAYALVDERLSPVLPGVAISTAIVPPLANVGLSLSLGAYSGAWGSFLLFFTNFLSILLVSSVVFLISGMAEEIRKVSGGLLVRRFGVAVFGFVVIAAMLSGELLGMLHQRKVTNQFRLALQEELVEYNISDMERLLYEEHDGRLVVLAEVSGPKEPTPRQIEHVQSKLSDIVSKPVELYLRTTITHDVSASGSISHGLVESMDGFHSPEISSDKVGRLQMAEQVVREYLDDLLGVHLGSIDSLEARGYRVIIANLHGVRALYPREIGAIEKQLQQRLDDEKVWFMVNQQQTRLTDVLGDFRAEFMALEVLSPEYQAFYNRIWDIAEPWFRDRQFWVEAWSISKVSDVDVVLFELKGPRAFQQEDLDALQAELDDKLGQTIKVYTRARIETVLGSRYPIAFEDLLLQLMDRKRLEHSETFNEILERMR